MAQAVQFPLVVERRVAVKAVSAAEEAKPMVGSVLPPVTSITEYLLESNMACMSRRWYSSMGQTAYSLSVVEGCPRVAVLLPVLVAVGTGWLCWLGGGEGGFIFIFFVVILVILLIVVQLVILHF